MHEPRKKPSPKHAPKHPAKLSAKRVAPPAARPSKPGSKPFFAGSKPFFGRGPKAGGRPARPSFGAHPDRPGPRDGSIGPGVRIIHEDADLIILDKPPGLLTAGTASETRETLFDMVKQYVRRRKGGRPRRGRPHDAEGPSTTAERTERVGAGVIHRLDKEASGLLVFSTTARAFEKLKEDFKSKRVHRIYLALVEGVLAEPGQSGTIQSYLKEERDGRVVSIRPDEFRGAGGAGAAGGAGGEEHDQARLAVTHYRVVATANNRTLLQLRLETGRKHQIRVHLSDRGHPIVGDIRYGAKTDPLRRLGLHATELGFEHPATGRRERFSSPAPVAFYTSVNATIPAPSEALERPTGPFGQGGLPAAARDAKPDTSWENVAEWYDELLAEKRNDHYDDVIVPGAVRLLAPGAGMRILDVACGQGVISRELSMHGAEVTGVDASASLVAAAQERSSEHVTYLAGDARELGALGLEAGSFDAATCVMGLGNIDPLAPVFAGVASLLKPAGSFVAVISHPAFRVPGQSSWGWDGRSQRQFRRVDGYLSDVAKPIQMHPGSAPEVTTLSFHRPLQAYVKALADAGLAVTALEEWAAQRVSTSGPRAEEENRSRREIPLFMAIVAKKV